MRIIISPAKKMRIDTDFFAHRHMPDFLDDTEILLDTLKQLSYEQAKQVWNCNDAIAGLNYERIQRMNLRGNLTPAIFSYEGIQYQYMAPTVFQTEELDYLQEHLRILSGFYGVLRPFDGVVPYRLEMQAKLEVPGADSLYGYWSRKLADQLATESSCILNLASKEYSKCISPYLGKDIRFVTCVFGQIINGKVVERATLVKMTRGEMVRYMAENKIKSIEEIKGFDRMNFRFDNERSDEKTYVFIQQPEQAESLAGNDREVYPHGRANG